MFLFSSLPGEMIQFDFCIFFRWVGSTTNQLRFIPPDFWNRCWLSSFFSNDFPGFNINFFTALLCCAVKNKFDRQVRELLFRKQRFSHFDLLFVSPNAACIWNVYTYLPTFHPYKLSNQIPNMEHLGRRVIRRDPSSIRPSDLELPRKFQFQSCQRSNVPIVF